MINTVNLPEFAILENNYDLEGQSVYFSHPVCEIRATTFDDLPTALAQLDRLQRQNYYLVGYIAYEAAYKLHAKLAPLQTRTDYKGNLIHFVAFNKRESVSNQDLASFLIQKGVYDPDASMPYIQDMWFNETFDQYHQNIMALHRYLQRGETYQTNYTASYRFYWSASYINIYMLLRAHQSSRYANFLPFSGQAVMSFSPELFFRKRKSMIEVKPMKGTMPRDAMEEKDRFNRSFLQSDEKNIAENLIIVDLLRNDLASFSNTASVTAQKLFDIETYPTVFQMTSTITSEVPLNTNFKTILEGLFPCGSITGAPKMRTMEITHELETSPRGVYTGAVGVIYPDNDMCFNVAIRTLSAENNHFKFGVGGGITTASVSKEEWVEMHLKAKFIKQMFHPDFKLIETFYYALGHGYDHLDKHLARLAYSAQCLFSIEINQNQIKARLTLYAEEVLAESTDNPFKIRLTLNHDGDINITHSPLKNQKNAPTETLLKVMLCENPIDTRSYLFQHKTTSELTRGCYDTRWHAYQKDHQMLDSIIFKNQNNIITEALYHNVIIECGGEMITSPVSEGLLPGIYRQKLLEKGKLTIKPITVPMLYQAQKVWLCNDVRGLQQATLIN